MSDRDSILLLEDILESCHKIKKYTKSLNIEAFIENDLIVDAVIRNFTIIGEAANRLDPDYRIMHPEIEWNRIRGFRNRIVHDYFGIDYEIVWFIITDYLDDLIDSIETIISY